MTPSRIDESSRRVIKIALSGGLQLHVLNIRNGFFVSSKEIALLFPKWKKRDLVEKMCSLKALRYENIIADKTKDAKLYEEALW